VFFLLILSSAVEDGTDVQNGILGLAVSSLAYSIVGAIVSETRQSLNGKKTFGTLVLFSAVWILVQLLWIDALDKSAIVFTVVAAGSASVLTVLYVTIRIWVFKDTPIPKKEAHMRPGTRPEWIESADHWFVLLNILCVSVLPLIIGPTIQVLQKGLTGTLLFPALSLCILAVFLTIWYTTPWIQRYFRERA
jgi:hypothetical protein